MMDATQAMMRMLWRAAQVIGLFFLWLLIAILLFDAGMHG